MLKYSRIFEGGGGCIYIRKCKESHPILREHFRDGRNILLLGSNIRILMQSFHAPSKSAGSDISIATKQHSTHFFLASNDCTIAESF